METDSRTNVLSMFMNDGFLPCCLVAEKAAPSQNWSSEHSDWFLRACEEARAIVLRSGLTHKEVQEILEGCVNKFQFKIPPDQLVKEILAHVQT